MYRYLFFVVLIGMTSNLYPQALEWGITGGTQYSHIRLNEDLLNDPDLEFLTQKGRIGWHAGLFGRINSGPFYFQPELILSQQRSDINLSNDTAEEFRTLAINEVGLPLLLGYEIIPGLSAQGGLVLNATTSTSTYSASSRIWHTYREQTFKAESTLVLGAEFRLDKLMLGINFQNNLGKDYLVIPIANERMEFNSTRSILQLRMAYVVGASKKKSVIPKPE